MKRPYFRKNGRTGIALDASKGGNSWKGERKGAKRRREALSRRIGKKVIVREDQGHFVLAQKSRRLRQEDSKLEPSSKGTFQKIGKWRSSVVCALVNRGLT